MIECWDENESVDWVYKLVGQMANWREVDWAGWKGIIQDDLKAC